MAADLEACWRYFVFGVPAKTSATAMNIRGFFPFHDSQRWMIWTGVDFGLIEKKLELFFEGISWLGVRDSTDDGELAWMLASVAKVSVEYRDGVSSGAVLNDIEKIANTKRSMGEQGNYCYIPPL